MKTKHIVLIVLLLLAFAATVFGQQVAPIKGENAYTLQANEQSYICLPRVRIAAISDSIAYYRKYQFVALQCDSLLQKQKALSANLTEQIGLKDLQIGKVTEAFELQTKQSKVWEQSATEYKTAYDGVLPQLEKCRKRCRSGWVAFGTTLGIAVAAITTTVLILK